ncbi:hypothetical protein SLEP1_g56352, partial [Rubroshorea leprosula]
MGPFTADHVGDTPSLTKSTLQELFKAAEEKEAPHFDVATAKLGFIFDVVYTKAGLIYTKKGCFLRLCSFTCSFVVLLLFLISIINKPMFHLSRVDIYITVSLLVGAVALELWAMYSMVSSHWAVPPVLFHDNPLVHKILRFILQYLHFLFPQHKKWSGKMGQFNLLDYYWNNKNDKVYALLVKNCSSPILAKWHRFMSTKFVEVPSCLKLREDYQNCLDSFFTDEFFEPSRRGKFLHQFETRLDVQGAYPNVLIEDRKSSKYLSDYMMYLLVRHPAMLLPAHSSSFWLDACCDKLKVLFSGALNMDHAFTLLLKRDDGREQQQSNISTPEDELQQPASNLVRDLNAQHIWLRWKIIKEVWIEMLLYAA